MYKCGKKGEEISYVDALFVATTSLCVTGLSPVVTATQWSCFGQGGNDAIGAVWRSGCGNVYNTSPAGFRKADYTF